MDQIVGAAVVVVVVILVIIGVVRVMQRRPAPPDHFGAGGRTTIPLGTHGIVKTAVDPSGIVGAAGEDWSARSGSGEAIAEGTPVTVTGQDGLTLIVEPTPAAPGSQGTG